MICPNCKTKNEEGALFCEKCGMQLSPDDQPTMMQDGPTIMETGGDSEEKAQPSKEKKRHHKTKQKAVEEPGKYKSAKGIITGLSALIVVMALMIGIGLWQDHSTSGDTASVTTTADSQEEDSSEDTTTAGTTTEEASTTEDTASEDLPDIEAQDHVDYTNVLYLNAYETFSADGYSFGYPNAFYKTVSKTSSGYRFESDDEYEWLEYSKEKMSGSQSTASAISSIRQNLKNRFNKQNDILYKETGVCIMGGVEKTDENQAVYYLARVQGNYIYTMEVGYEYPDPSNTTEKNQKDYYVDCLYRYCSFSGGTYSPRSYSTFLDGDMGSKK